MANDDDEIVLQIGEKLAGFVLLQLDNGIDPNTIGNCLLNTAMDLCEAAIGRDGTACWLRDAARNYRAD